MKMWTENEHKHFNITQDDYFKLNGVSYSWIKNEGQFIKATPRMRFGSLVDAYLFEPEKYDGTYYELVKPVAAVVADLLKGVKGKPQVAVTADFCHDGKRMPYKGRIDLLTSKVVIDLKISEMDIERSINFFGYDRQIGGYCLATGCEKGLIISVHPRTKKVQKAIINPDKVREFWEVQILKHGNNY